MRPRRARHVPSGAGRGDPPRGQGAGAASWKARGRPRRGRPDLSVQPQRLGQPPGRIRIAARTRRRGRALGDRAHPERTATRTTKGSIAMTTAPVIFINCFEVPKGREDEFFAHWSEVNTYMKRKPGFVSNRLHRAKTPDARIGFINYVLWEPEEAWAAAHDEGFCVLVLLLLWCVFSPFL